MRWFRQRVWPWIWLGVRLCVGAGKAMAMRTVLLGSACAVGVVLVLAAMAVPVVSDAQREREYARTPVIEKATGAGLKMVVIYDAIDSRPLLRVAVADAATDSPRPPGVSTFPRPGEAIVSPALRRLIESDESVRYRFPQTIVSDVSREGLVAPDELLAYVGVEPAEMAHPGIVSGYQDAGNERWRESLGTSELERMLTPPRVVSASFALFLVLPLSVLLGICVRFDASRRDRRLAALRLVGASQRQAYLSTAAEMSFIASVGVIAGLVLFKLLAKLSQGWSIGRFHWYASDLAIPVSRIIVLSVLVVGLAVAVSALGSRPAVKSPIRIRRSGKAASPSYWRLLPLVIAPAALLIAPWTALRPFDRLVVLGIGIVAAVVSLATVTPLILSGAGSAVTRLKSLPLWAQLAARRAAHSPAITPKLVTSVLVAVFIAGFGMMIGTTVRTGKPIPAVTEQESQRAMVAEAFGVSGKVVESLRASRAITSMGLSERVVAVGPERSQHANVIWTSCKDAAVLIEKIGQCADGHAYRVKYANVGESGRAAGLKQDVELTVQSGPRSGEVIKVPGEVLEVSGADYGCYCDIIITTAVASGDLVVQLADTGDQFWTDVARLAPATRFQGNQEQQRGFDADAVLTLIFVGLLLTVSLGLIAFVIASIDRGVESRHRDAPLLALGVPIRFLRFAEAAQLLLVIVSGLTLGLGLLALTTRSWAGVFDMSFTAVVAPLLPLFGSVVGGMVLLMLAVMALTTRNRTLSPEDLRRE